MLMCFHLFYCISFKLASVFFPSNDIFLHVTLSLHGLIVGNPFCVRMWLGGFVRYQLLLKKKNLVNEAI